MKNIVLVHGGFVDGARCRGGLRRTRHAVQRFSFWPQAVFSEKLIRRWEMRIQQTSGLDDRWRAVNMFIERNGNLDDFLKQ